MKKKKNYNQGTPSPLRMPKDPVLSALVYSLWATITFSRRLPMFPFLVLKAVPIAKWILPEVAVTSMTSTRVLKCKKNGILA